MLASKELQIERRRRHVREHRSAGRDLLPASDDDRPCASTVNDDALDGSVTAHAAALRLEPLDQGPRQLAGSALGSREADTLGETREQPAVEAAGRGFRAQIRVQGIAGEEPCPSLAAKVLLRQPPHREAHRAQEADPLPAPEPGGDARSGTKGRERRDHRVEQRVADLLPRVVEAQPGLAVARREGVEARGGLPRILRDEGAGPVGGGMGEGKRAAPPGEAEALQTERANDRRRSRKRMEGAEDVVAEARLGQLGGADCATRLALGLEDLDLPAGVGKQVRADETVRPRADDDRVRHTADASCARAVRAAPAQAERA